MTPGMRKQVMRLNRVRRQIMGRSMFVSRCSRWRAAG